MRTIINSSTGEFIGERIRIPQTGETLTLGGRDFLVVAVTDTAIFTNRITLEIEP